MISNELLLLLIGHASQGVVLALELTFQAGQGYEESTGGGCLFVFLTLRSHKQNGCIHLSTITLNRQLLNSSALSTAVVGGQGESLDAAAGTNAARQHVVGVKVITTLRQKNTTKKLMFCSRCV